MCHVLKLWYQEEDLNMQTWGVSPLRLAAFPLFCKTSNLTITVDWSLVKQRGHFYDWLYSQIRRISFSHVNLTCITERIKYKHGLFWHFYRPPKKREGNVFSRVCLSFCSQGGSHATITHNTLDLTIQGTPDPSPGHSTLLYRETPHPRHDQTCSLWTRCGRQEGGSHPTGMLSCSSRSGSQLTFHVVSLILRPLTSSVTLLGFHIKHSDRC